MKNGLVVMKSASERSWASVAKATSISRLLLASRTWICSPIARAAGSTSLIVAAALAAAGLTSTAIRLAAGTSSRNSSSRGCRLGREHGRDPAGRGDHGDSPAHQFCRQRRQSIQLTLRPAVLHRHVVALDITGVLEALAKCVPSEEKVIRCRAEKTDHRHRRLLRARREWPHCRRAAEQRDELAAPHGLPSGRGSHPTIW